MTKWIGIGCLALLAAAPAVAQEKPAPAPPATAAEKPAAAPELPAAVRQDINSLQVKIAGLAEAQQVLQKEFDATTAQFQRVVQQAQAACAAVPGYELAQTLTCVRKPEPKNKDEPKKESPQT